MISTMSYNSPQSELFARSLRRRLQSLTPDRSNSESSPKAVDASETDLPDAEEPNGLLAALSGDDDKERVRRILERGLRIGEKSKERETTSDDNQGLTFPPNRFLNGDLLIAKFRSETEHLTNKEIKPSPEVSPDEDDVKAVDIGDSDLFFDFDIGSPDQLETDEPRIINPSDTEELEEQGEDCQEIVSRSGSDTPNSSTVLDLDNGTPESRHNQSPSNTEPSTAYGSTSSGLYSDSDNRAIHKEDDDLSPKCPEGASLLPEDWIKNQASSVGDASSPTCNDEVPPIVIEQSVEEISSIPDVETSSEVCSDLTDSSKSTDSVTICIGTTEKSVAQSKLQALLAQLDKGGDYGLPSTNKKSSKESSRDSAVTGAISKSSPMGRWQSTLEMTDYERAKVDRSDESSKEPRLRSKGSTEDVRKEDGEKKEKYRRCSSLRSGKTPPGTPGRRKIVRFADVFGLEIADIKTFLDEVPNIPKSAFKDLKDAELSDMESDTGSDLTFPVQPPTAPPSVSTYAACSTPTMAPLFNQPCNSSEFFNILRDRKVCLESAYMSDTSNIKGIVRVVNLDYNKKVFIKCTLDDWKTTDDISADYVVGSCDGFSDKFTFGIDYSTIAGIIGRRLEFCIRFECANNDYWDNNFGKNYIFQCFGPSPTVAKNTSVPITSRLPVQTSLSQSPSGLNEDPWHLYL